MSAADLAFEPRNAEDYRHQGTTDFDSEELLLVRANLKKSPHLRVAAVAFWEAMGKREHEDLITETEYRYVHSGLHARCHTLHGRPPLVCSRLRTLLRRQCASPRPWRRS
jgi:hypothetical protein